jgi:mutual gliding-motility protein MglA
VLLIEKNSPSAPPYSGACNYQRVTRSLDNMINNLTEHRMKLENIPWVLQYNKRDLANAMPYQQLEKDLNRFSVPSFEAIALEGRAVFATLKAITRMVCQTEV